MDIIFIGGALISFIITCYLIYDHFKIKIELEKLREEAVTAFKKLAVRVKELENKNQDNKEQ